MATTGRCWLSLRAACLHCLLRPPGALGPGSCSRLNAATRSGSSGRSLSRFRCSRPGERFRPNPSAPPAAGDAPGRPAPPDQLHGHRTGTARVRARPASGDVHCRVYRRRLARSGPNRPRCPLAPLSVRWSGLTISPQWCETGRRDFGGLRSPLTRYPRRSGVRRENSSAGAGARREPAHRYWSRAPPSRSTRTPQLSACGASLPGE